MAVTLNFDLRSGGGLRFEPPAPADDGASVFCFGMAHSGAAEFWRLIGALCAAADRPVFNLEPSLRSNGVRAEDLAPAAWRALSGLRGYVAMAPGPALWPLCDASSRARRVVLLRDPRDVAATAYVSLGASARPATIADFLAGPAFADILQSYRAYLAQPRRRDDLILRYEHALDGWREIAVDLVAWLDLALSPGQARAVADAAPVLKPGAIDLHTRDATIQALIDLNACAEVVNSELGFALEALGCPGGSALWRLAGPGAIERTIARLAPAPAPDEAPPPDRVGETDPVLHHRLRANACMVREVGGRRIELETDAFGRRVTVGQPAVGEKLVALYGCSFTFGTTSTAEETFCSRIQAMAPKWRIENHGVAGYSQSRNLIALERESRFNPADWVGFCWIRDHLRRNAADLGWVQATSKGLVESAGDKVRVATLPRAALDAKGELALTAIRYPRPDLLGLDVAEYEPSPFYLDQICFKLFERADALVKGYGGRFFVVDLHGGMSPALTRMCQESGIALVKTLSRGPEYFTTPTDPHPNALAHQIYAEKIYEYLVTSL